AAPDLHAARDALAGVPGLVDGRGHAVDAGLDHGADAVADLPSPRRIGALAVVALANAARRAEGRGGVGRGATLDLVVGVHPLDPERGVEPRPHAAHRIDSDIARQPPAILVEPVLEGDV